MLVTLYYAWTTHSLLKTTRKQWKQGLRPIINIAGCKITYPQDVRDSIIYHIPVVVVSLVNLSTNPALNLEISAKAVISRFQTSTRETDYISVNFKMQPRGKEKSIAGHQGTGSFRLVPEKEIVRTQVQQYTGIVDFSITFTDTEGENYKKQFKYQLNDLAKLSWRIGLATVSFYDENFPEDIYQVLVPDV